MKVPLIRRDPSLGKKRIAFAVRPAPHGGLQRTPIFAVEGGPGYASSRTEPAYTGLFRGLLRTHPLVLVDMRGTGRSHGLSCPERAGGPGARLHHGRPVRAQPRAKFEAYTTAMAADDINDVRRALGYGRSRSTATPTARSSASPTRSAIPDTLRALVLDSAYPARGESGWYPSLPKTGIRSYVISCERDPEVPAATPRSAWRAWRTTCAGSTAASAR